MTEKLTSKDRLEIAVQSSLQFIPYIGSSLSTVYFSTKQEKRFKRIESFYEEISEQLRNIESTLSAFDYHDEESLVAIIERINDEVERETSIEKRAYLKNYFINILQSPTTKSNYDERRILLETLSSITLLEFQVLLSHSEFSEHIKDIFNEIEPSLRHGASSRLETLGLLQSFYFSDTYVGQSPVHKNIYISDFGKKFINFCL
ncbi:hypothetical protein [Lysinibacillus capsici]|uniref:hypothetical protein n=1 Tax=Lysinibacillus capsici TaxID=2115968 RepID=UPI0036BF04E4